VTAVLHDSHARPVSSRGGAVALAAAALLASCVACVDTGRAAPSDASTGPDAAQPVTCAPPSAAPYSGNAVIPSGDTAMAGPYAWKNVAIKGGGFVSGIITSPALKGLVFARTDVGGAYRFDPTNQRWTPLTDWVGNRNAGLVGIESIAVDPVDPNRVYIAAGQYLTAGNGAILSSTDMGRSWTQNSISAPMGGNADGRSMGERLAVDPNLPSTLYFGSRNAGLWKSTDSAQTWTQVGSFTDPPMTGPPICGTTNGCTASGNNSAGTGYGLTFVVFDPLSGSPGHATPAIYVGVGMTTGPSLYRSTDAGATWAAVVGTPAGMIPHHAVLDGCGDLYLTYNNGSGPNSVTAGAVWRYTPPIEVWTNVSPPGDGFGFGGISADAAHPGTLLVTTIDDWAQGAIYRTTDGGASWTPVTGAARGDVAGAQWLYWHTSNLPAMGWMGDVEIDPFDPAHAFFITGQGLWATDDLTAADAGGATSWTFADAGLEETVVLDLASPPTGAPLLSGVGDIGGFQHTNLDVSPTAGMSANPILGNTTSLDFAESAPLVVARVGTGSSSPKQTGATSKDGGATWTPFATLPAATGTTTPNSGSIAVSADGSTFVWVPKSGTPSYSTDQGTTWTPSTGLTAGALVASDRVNPSKFYASGRGTMLLSTDGGKTFTSITAASSGRPRPVFGNEGDVWMSTGTGLTRSKDSGATWQPVAGVTGASAVGFGIPATAGAYPAVYLAGAVNSTWGTYRSDDAGVTWQRIDDPQHQFGISNVLAGDRTQYGRIYLGTSGRGIVYGDPQPQ
jgi:photosystem II stability/assembly factor-like uncharacterized protein